MKVINKNAWFPSVFDDLLRQNDLDRVNYEKFNTPAVNISENLTNFTIDVAVPGFKKSDFAIEIDDDILTVKSNKDTNDSEVEGVKYSRQEFDYTNFSRTFTLSDAVDKEKISASYTDGILSITLDKVEEKKEIKRMVEIS